MRILSALYMFLVWITRMQCSYSLLIVLEEHRYIFREIMATFFYTPCYMVSG